MRKPLPSIEEIEAAFAFDYDQGRLVWKVRKDQPLRVNNTFAGTPAGSPNQKGYLRVVLNGRRYLVHRLIWKLVHGTEPDLLDHINGNPADNRPDNLRAADNNENMANRRRRVGKALPKGVFVTASGRLEAKVKFRGQLLRLGLFDDADQAHAAYREAARKLQGDFARAD